MAKLRVGVIGRTGGGDYGHAIDELWKGVEGTEIVAVADSGAEGLAKAAGRLGLDPAKPGQTFADWRQMLSAVKPDIAVICMRHIDCHAEMAVAAAEAGARGIFMEKPFVRSLSEADAVIDACRKAGTKLSLAHVNRHSPTFAAVRDLVEDGRVGTVLELRGRGKEDQRGGGEDLWVLGPHVLDMMVDLGGAPRWCVASVSRQGRPITKADAIAGPEGIGPLAGDAVNAMFGLADGPVGHFASIRDAGLKQPNFGLTIVGTKGAIQIRCDQVPHAYLREAPLWRVDKEFPWRPLGPEGLESTPPAGDVDRAAERAGWARLAVADLLDAIAEDREPATGMYSSRTIVEMNTAVYRAALAGDRVEWPIATGGSPLA